MSKSAKMSHQIPDSLLNQSGEFYDSHAITNNSITSHIQNLGKVSKNYFLYKLLQFMTYHENIFREIYIHYKDLS